MTRRKPPNIYVDPKPEVRVFTPTEAAWLAGVIDGEGSIGLYDYGKEGRRVYVQMGNTNKAFVQRMRDVIGCGSSVTRTSFHKSHKGRKPMFHYGLKGSSRCYWVLTQIVGYLIIKRVKAEKIIHELETKPFGRWANATPKHRAASSKRMKAVWAKRRGLK